MICRLTNLGSNLFMISGTLSCPHCCLHSQHSQHTLSLFIGRYYSSESTRIKLLPSCYESRHRKESKCQSQPDSRKPVRLVLWEKLVEATSPLSERGKIDFKDEDLRGYGIDRIPFDLDALLDGSHDVNLSLEPPVLFHPFPLSTLKRHPINLDKVRSGTMRRLINKWTIWTVVLVPILKRTNGVISSVRGKSTITSTPMPVVISQEPEYLHLTLTCATSLG